MLLLSTLGKFGAVFVSIPEPIIGGVSIVLFGECQIFKAAFFRTVRILM